MFNIGDVVCVNTPDGVWIPAVCDGEVGMIVSIDYKGTAKILSYGVEFFEHNALRHTLGGLCKEGYGYWMLPEDLKLYELDFEPCDTSVHGGTLQVAEREVDQEELTKVLEGDETHV